MADHPTTAQEAARTQHDLRQAGDGVVDDCRQAGRAAAMAEWLYRRAEALGEPRVRHGKDGDARKRMLLALPLAEDLRRRAGQVAAMVGVDPPDGTWETVGDLRFLRDDCQSVASAANHRAFLHSHEFDYARSVVAWARAEYEQTLGAG